MSNRRLKQWEADRKRAELEGRLPPAPPDIQVDLTLVMAEPVLDRMLRYLNHGGARVTAVELETPMGSTIRCAVRGLDGYTV